jgi:hypothetical protein
VRLRIGVGGVRFVMASVRPRPEDCLVSAGRDVKNNLNSLQLQRLTNYRTRMQKYIFIGQSINSLHVFAALVS